MTGEERLARLPGLMRDRQARRLLASRLTPGLPVDADPPELRRKAACVGDTLTRTLDDLLTVQHAFFDRLTAEWATRFPDIPARPVRFQEDARVFKIVLALSNAGQAFALRPRLPHLKRALKAMDGAPKKKIDVIVTIR